MPETNLSSDRNFDLSLRLLTIFVLFSLACCAAFLANNLWFSRYRGAEKALDSQAIAPAALPQPAAVAKPTPPAEVLMDPRKTFRCDEKGRVSFSDRACDSGAEQLLPLNSTQGAPAGASNAANAAGAPNAASAGNAASAPGATNAANPANDRGGR